MPDLLSIFGTPLLPVCLPCCEVIACVLECQAKGGGGGGGGQTSGRELIGFVEFGTPSSPPKRYRKKTLGGSRSTMVGSGACTNGPSVQTHYGSAEYHALTGVVTNNMHYAVDSVEDPYGPAEISFLPSCSNTTGPYGCPTESCSTSTTLFAVAGLGTCVDCGPGGWNSSTGDASAELSVEDTAADAEARLRNSSGGPESGWSAWGDGSCSASRAQVGETINIRAARWRVTRAGLIASTGYDLTIEYWRRPVDASAPFTLAASTILSGTADGTGTLVFTGDVPNDTGYETEVRTDCVFTLTA